MSEPMFVKLDPNNPDFIAAKFYAAHPLQSLRAQLAGYAIQGIVGNPTWNQEAMVMAGITDESKVAAAIAVRYADALLAELARTVTSAPSASAQPGPAHEEQTGQIP